jgi:hypothetical protein
MDLRERIRTYALATTIVGATALYGSTAYYVAQQQDRTAEPYVAYAATAGAVAVILGASAHTAARRRDS